jgi:hypothetical protein
MDLMINDASVRMAAWVSILTAAILSESGGRGGNAALE